MAELEALSKLKMAGKLHYWRGTVEIDEHELHAICDEIQAEYDKAVAAMSRAAGKWARADAELREHDGTRWYELFGTPERAMRTIALIGNRYPCDEGCDPSGEKCKVCPFADAPSCRIKRDHPEESPLLEWLRGASE